MSDIQHVVLGIYGAANELLDEFGVDADAISPMPDAPETAVICRIPGSDPVVARVLLNVNAGKFAVEFELHAPDVKRLVGALDEAIVRSDSMDKPEV